jgi:hypothetical protein
LARLEFSNGQALVETINAILAHFEKVALKRVFLEWIERFCECIETDGGYGN